MLNKITLLRCFLLALLMICFCKDCINESFQQPQNTLGVICYFKNERHILNEWLHHYCKMGFTHFWLIDNGSEDNYKIDPYFVENFGVEINLHKEPDITQQDAYKKYLPQIKKNCQWIAVLDMDEFIYSKKENKIPNILSKIPDDVGTLNIQMKNYLPGNIIDPPSKIESATLYFPDSSKWTKSISRCSFVKSLNVHRDNVEPHKSIFYPHDSSDLSINHYRYQSFEYLYGIKEGRGGGTHKGKYKNTDHIKDMLSQKTIEDTFLKENSSKIIQRAYENLRPTPLTTLYPDSSWLRKPEEFRRFQEISSVEVLKKYWKIYIS
tara:strand:+ start:1843 stop:2808 length:966 start_codon:yes stop_codon:yes gene_type:complete